MQFESGRRSRGGMSDLEDRREARLCSKVTIILRRTAFEREVLAAIGGIRDRQAQLRRQCFLRGNREEYEVQREEE